MESAVLRVVLDSSIVITADRKTFPFLNWSKPYKQPTRNRALAVPGHGSRAGARHLPRQNAGAEPAPPRVHRRAGESGAHPSGHADSLLGWADRRPGGGERKC